MKKTDHNLDLTDYFTPSTMTLATSGVDGAPHAAPVYFAARREKGGIAPLDWRLYFFSESKSQHSQDLARHPIAAGAIYPECHSWQEIHGLQLRGRVTQIRQGEAGWEPAWKAYKNKFPFVNELKPIIQRNTLYAFTPFWMRVVDNRKGFGYKFEWDAGTPS